jgi:hypothetical protein
MMESSWDCLSPWAATPAQVIGHVLIKSHFVLVSQVLTRVAEATDFSLKAEFPTQCFVLSTPGFTFTSSIGAVGIQTTVVVLTAAVIVDAFPIAALLAWWAAVAVIISLGTFTRLIISRAKEGIRTVIRPCLFTTVALLQ